jgi:hypothetical protein
VAVAPCSCIDDLPLYCLQSWPPAWQVALVRVSAAAGLSIEEMGVMRTIDHDRDAVVSAQQSDSLTGFPALPALQYIQLYTAVYSLPAACAATAAAAAVAMLPAGPLARCSGSS